MDNNTNIQLAHQTPLFQAVYRLYVAWHIRCETIPKKDRFTIGQKTESLLLETLTLVVTAYHTKEPIRKKEILSQANISLECAKITIRLAKDVKALEQRWYVEYESRLQEIGKQLGGWMRQTQSSPFK
jgi:hypothetical protein